MLRWWSAEVDEWSVRQCRTYVKPAVAPASPAYVVVGAAGTEVNHAQQWVSWRIRASTSQRCPAAGVLMAVPSAPNSPHAPSSPAFYHPHQFVPQASRLPSAESAGSLPYALRPGSASRMDSQARQQDLACS